MRDIESYAISNGTLPRVIEVYDLSGSWIKRVLLMEKKDHAICWQGANTIEDSKEVCSTYAWSKWREVGVIQIIKDGNTITNGDIIDGYKVTLTKVEK